jgi:hypothetical protein
MLLTDFLDCMQYEIQSGMYRKTLTNRCCVYARMLTVPAALVVCLFSGLGPCIYTLGGLGRGVYKCEGYVIEDVCEAVIIDSHRATRDTLYPQKLALTSPTSGGRSVGIVRSLTTRPQRRSMLCHMLGKLSFWITSISFVMLPLPAPAVLRHLAFSLIRNYISITTLISCFLSVTSDWALIAP